MPETALHKIPLPGLSPDDLRSVEEVFGNEDPLAVTSTGGRFYVAGTLGPVWVLGCDPDGSVYALCGQDAPDTAPMVSGVLALAARNARATDPARLRAALDALPPVGRAEASDAIKAPLTPGTRTLFSPADGVALAARFDTVSLMIEGAEVAAWNLRPTDDGLRVLAMPLRGPEETRAPDVITRVGDLWARWQAGRARS